MLEYKGDLILEIDLFCAALPQYRGRAYNKVTAILDNQYEMIERLKPYHGMRLAMDMYVDIEFIYRKLKGQAMRYDIDNLVKALLDNLQRQEVIVDDKKVIGLSCVKRQGTDDHTSVRIYHARNYI